MSNLIPTPRTDKTGRTVIRHMKPDQAASRSAKIPPASLLSSAKDGSAEMSGQAKSALAAEVIEHLDVNRFDTTKAPYSAFHPLASHQGLMKDLSGSDLKKLSEVTVTLKGRGHMAARLMLGKALGENNTVVIQAVCTHREWLSKNPTLLAPFQQFVNMLVDESIIPADDTDSLIHSSEHLAVAYQSIKQLGYPEESHLKNIGKIVNHDYIELLLNNADNIDELLEYRRDRGMDKTGFMEPHDAKDFADYLAQGQVRDGWI